jgi:vacuolar-type H+-ATPase subunit I/STV1
MAEKELMFISTAAKRLGINRPKLSTLLKSAGVEKIRKDGKDYVDWDSVQTVFQKAVSTGKVRSSGRKDGVSKRRKTATADDAKETTFERYLLEQVRELKEERKAIEEDRRALQEQVRALRAEVEATQKLLTEKASGHQRGDRPGRKGAVADEKPKPRSRSLLERGLERLIGR